MDTAPVVAYVSAPDAPLAFTLIIIIMSARMQGYRMRSNRREDGNWLFLAQFGDVIHVT